MIQVQDIPGFIVYIILFGLTVFINKVSTKLICSKVDIYLNQLYVMTTNRELY